VSADDLRPPGREIIDLARRARTPSDEDRDRVYQALMAGLGGAAALGTAKVATAAAKVAGKSSLAWLKWTLAGAILSSASIGTYAYTARRHVGSVAATDAVNPTSQEPSQDTAVPEIAPPLDPIALPAPSAELGATRPSKVQPSAKTTGDDLGQELSLLHQAHAEWRSGNAAHALELAREHAHRYPNSQLRFERYALEVRSLCALGREAEARKIADQLRAQAPNSPVIAALKDSCVGK
jgi:hypothetical protein